MPPLAPTFAFGIGVLPMLWWLAAASAPLLIHLWTKRKYREVPWAAMEYLLAAIQKNARRVQVEQWLLLLVRTAIVVCVVLAVSEPYWENLGIRLLVGERVHKLIVIDASYSMAYKPTDVDRFSRAKELAAQIVSESPPGDGFTLLLLADPPRVIVGRPSFERQDITEEIKNLKLPQAGADLPATVTKVEEVLEQAVREQPKLARQEVYFLTDLGRNSWSPNLNGPQAAAELHGKLNKLKTAGASLVVIDLGQANSENIAVTDLRCRDSYATIGRELTFEAAIKNFGRQARTHWPVEFLVDGQRVKEEFVDLGPDSAATTAFTHRFDTPGQHTVEAKIAGDLLDIDNHRWLTVPVKESLRVLLVDGTAEGDKRGSAAFIQDRVIDAAGGTARVVGESALSELELKDFDCVVLCNVAQFTASEAKILDRYLQQGGGLVFFLGDRVNAESYNRELGGGGNAKIRILPAKLDAPVPARTPAYRFDPLGYRHPIIEPFKGREGAGLSTALTFKYFRLLPVADSAAKTALAFDSGDPAIVEERIHRGRVFVVAVPGWEMVDPETKYFWTTWTGNYSFVPVMKEILSAAVNRRGEENSLVGKPIGGVFAAAGGTLSLKTPDGKTEQIRPTSVGGEDRWEYADTFTSGLYTAEYASLPSQPQFFSVNVDTAESDLTKLDPSELPPEFVTRSNWQNLDSRPTTDITPRDWIHAWFLYALLILVLLETFLAWLFGYWAR